MSDEHNRDKTLMTDSWGRWCDTCNKPAHPSCFAKNQGSKFFARQAWENYLTEL